METPDLKPPIGETTIYIGITLFFLGFLISGC